MASSFGILQVTAINFLEIAENSMMNSKVQKKQIFLKL